MGKSHKLLGMVIGLLLSTTAMKAQAGVVTTVIVNNQLKNSVSIVPSNQIQFLGIVSGILPTTIKAGGTANFTVTSPYSNIASIHFSYTSGAQGCRFDTSLTTKPTILGTQIPTWTKSGTSTGYSFVNCGATITNVNSNNYNYTVQFTLH